MVVCENHFILFYSPLIRRLRITHSFQSIWVWQSFQVIAMISRPKKLLSLVQVWIIKEFMLRCLFIWTVNFQSPEVKANAQSFNDLRSKCIEHFYRPGMTESFLLILFSLGSSQYNLCYRYLFHWSYNWADSQTLERSSGDFQASYRCTNKLIDFILNIFFCIFSRVEWKCLRTNL